MLHPKILNLHTLSLQPGATTRVLSCPPDSRPTVRMGEFGKGLSSTDVTAKLIDQCISAEPCTLDMKALGQEYDNKTLRVDWFCSCGEGLYDLPPGDGVGGTCEPCPGGTYKADGMNDCQVSQQRPDTASPCYRPAHPCCD